MDTQWTQFPDLEAMSGLDFLQMSQDTGGLCDPADFDIDFSATDGHAELGAPKADPGAGDITRLLTEISSRLEAVERNTMQIEKIGQTVTGLDISLHTLSSVAEEILEGLSRLRQGLWGYVRGLIEHALPEAREDDIQTAPMNEE